MTTYSSTASRRLAVALAALSLVVFLLAGCSRPAPSSEATVPTASSAAAKPSALTPVANAAHYVYVCPMHAHVRQHGPGQCPLCGMTLVKQTATPADAASSAGFAASCGTNLSTAAGL